MDGFIMENPIKMDDLGVPLFLETPMIFFGNTNKNSPISSSAALPPEIVDAILGVAVGIPPPVWYVRKPGENRCTSWDEFSIFTPPTFFFLNR